MPHKTRGTANSVLGWGLIGLGTLFLLAKFLAFDPWRFLWPFFIIIPGLLFFYGMSLVGKNAGPLAIPGGIVTMAGIILLYQSVFGHWESWAYAWALIFPASVGIGLIVWGTWSGEERLHQMGRGFLKAGLVIFAIGCVFFEAVLDISGFRKSPIGKLLFPGLLIGVGLLILIWPGERKRPPWEASENK